MKKFIILNFMILLTCKSQSFINHLQYYPEKPYRLEKKIFYLYKSYTPEEWNQCGIQNFYEGNFDLSEFCFIQAIQYSNNEIPQLNQINDRLKYFLNLLFFYYYASREIIDYNNKLEKYSNEYIEIIKKREDLILTSLEEIEKRNIKILYNYIINEYYKTKNQHTDTFLKIYIQHLLYKNESPEKIQNHIEKIQNQNLKKEIYQQLIDFYKDTNNYNEYLNLYNFIKKNNKLNLLKYFKTEDLFLANFNLWKENVIFEIPENLLKDLIQQPISPELYKKYLYYSTQKKFFELSLYTIQIKNSCSFKNFFYQYLCLFQNEVEKIIIEKEILNSYSIEDFKEARKKILYFQ